MRSSSGLMLLLFCSLTAVNSQPGRWRVGKTWSGAPGSCARCVAQMGSPMTTTAASVPTTCEYCDRLSFGVQAMVSAPDGFSFGTNISVFLLHPPEALITWILFPDALFAPWGSVGEPAQPEHSVRAEGKEWLWLWCLGRIKTEWSCYTAHSEETWPVCYHLELHFLMTGRSWFIRQSDASFIIFISYGFGLLSVAPGCPSL